MSWPEKETFDEMVRRIQKKVAAKRAEQRANAEPPEQLDRPNLKPRRYPEPRGDFALFD